MLQPGLVGPAEGFGLFESGYNSQQAARMAAGGSRGSKGGRPKGDVDGVDDETYTTVMLRNIPNKYTRQMLVDQLFRAGFQGDIDYLYLPTDFANRCNVGYCFANLRTPEARQRFVQAFDGVAAQTCLPGFNSYKVCQVTKAKWQGREENVRRLRGSAELMAQLAGHPDWLPLLMDEAGNPEPFACEELGPGLPKGGVCAGGCGGGPAAKRQAKKRGAKPGPMAPLAGGCMGGSPMMGQPMGASFADMGGGPGGDRGRGRGAMGKGKGKVRFEKGPGGFPARGPGPSYMGGLSPMGMGPYGGMLPAMGAPYGGMPMMAGGLPLLAQAGFQYMPTEGYDAGYMMSYPMVGADPQMLAAAQYGVGAAAWWQGQQHLGGGFAGGEEDEDDAGSPDEGM